MAATLPLTLRVRQIWPFIVSWLLACVLVFQYMTIQRSQLSHDFTPLIRGDLPAYGKILLYYLPVEVVSIMIIIKVLQLYQHWLKLDSLTLNASHLMRYEVAFLPAILIAIPLFCPITNTLRYGLLFSLQQGWGAYFPGYFFTWRMFLNYLLPVLLFSYGYLNVNLMLDYFDWHHSGIEGAQPVAPAFISPHAEKVVDCGEVNIDLVATGLNAVATIVTDVYPGNSTLLSDTPVLAAKFYLSTLEASDALGQTHLQISTVHYFEVQKKNYVAFTATGKYRVRKTLTELEVELDPRCFYRLNRSVIVNLSCILNYSHWQYDKYIVRLTDEKTEFVMQRNRLEGLRLGLSKVSR